MCWHPQGVSPDSARPGLSRRVRIWLGRAGFGLTGLFADDLSAEGFGLLRWVLRNSDVTRSGDVWTGDVWLGGAWRGAVM